MPYKVDEISKGCFKTCDAKNKCLSKKCLTKKTARRQQIAVAISESKRTGKPVSAFFL